MKTIRLFEDPIYPRSNILPREGVVNYYGQILSTKQANQYFDAIYQTIPWQHDQALIYGNLITTLRKVAWFGDEAYAYTYSGTTRHALPWTPELTELKELVEMRTGRSFNSCLLNLYEDGATGMAWHSDDEKALGKNASIASISLGAPRKFYFKNKRDSTMKVSLVLEHGSLLLMQETTQTHWLHSLPKTKKVRQPRINLTFRTMVASTIC